MTARSAMWGTAAVAALALVACKTTQAPAPNSAGQVTAATPTAAPSGGGGTSIPTLVNVNLQNVLNNLSVSLKVNRDNIPVTAQVPIDVAANVCGVSVSALAASIASGQAGCTATTTTPQLTQAVQQQIASGGSVTGGPQTMGAPAGTTTNNMI
jgi:ABC-type proline/glycine betaine transport system substrate-binding protein